MKQCCCMLLSCFLISFYHICCTLYSQWLQHSAKRQKKNKKPKPTKANEKTQLTKKQGITKPQTPQKPDWKTQKIPPCPWEKKKRQKIILPNKPVAGGMQFLQTLIEFHANHIVEKNQI